MKWFRHCVWLREKGSDSDGGPTSSRGAGPPQGGRDLRGCEDTAPCGSARMRSWAGWPGPMWSGGWVVSFGSIEGGVSVWRYFSVELETNFTVNLPRLRRQSCKSVISRETVQGVQTRDQKGTGEWVCRLQGAGLWPHREEGEEACQGAAEESRCAWRRRWGALLECTAVTNTALLHVFKGILRWYHSVHFTWCQL